ncbi:MAG: acyl transferase [Bacteroidia bacterium]|nr:acyl transferase [Bacteroidia bacterium]
MFSKESFIKDIFSESIADFNKSALSLFRYQASANPVYREFLRELHINASDINSIEDIPFLPVEFFKRHQVKTGDFKPELVFTSSGTTQSVTSSHYVESSSVYIKSFIRGFHQFLGNPEEYIIIALLPSYTERGSSSLVYMVNYLIKAGQHPLSGFVPLNESTASKIQQLDSEAKKANRKLLLVGVSFALLHLCDHHLLHLNHTIIIETGGMKGRRKEITREELHAEIKNKLNPKSIISEYGMTELLSQAYTIDGRTSFFTPPQMKILVRDINDPFCILPEMKNGALNIIDLANVSSCAFLATSDIGKTSEDGSFEVLGRIDNSDLRGCNLMYY